MNEEDIAHYFIINIRLLDYIDCSTWYSHNQEEEVIYSCCGDEMTIDLIDYGRCPTCKEHCM